MATKKKAARRPAAGKVARKTASRPSSARTAKTKGPSEGLTLSSVSPSFTVNDVEASLGWYRDVLGFREGGRWERDGKLLGAELSAGKASFMLGQDDWKKGRDRAKGQGVRIFCLTGQDIDRLAARIQARGGKLAQEPRDQPWGVRDIALVDPDGYNLTIAAPLKKKR